MNKDMLLLIGGGGHCRSVIDVIEQENRFSIAGIIDKKELIGSEILGYKVLGCDEDLKDFRHNFTYALVTVGQIKTAEIRKELYTLLKTFDYQLPTIISPFSYVSKHSLIGEGTVIMHHALVNVKSKIGKNCIINSKALVEHDCLVEDHCHISTGAILNGGACIKTGTFYGSNATCKEYTQIENFVKAGSVVK